VHDTSHTLQPLHRHATRHQPFIQLLNVAPPRCQRIKSYTTTSSTTSFPAQPPPTLLCFTKSGRFARLRSNDGMPRLHSHSPLMHLRHSSHLLIPQTNKMPDRQTSRPRHARGCVRRISLLHHMDPSHGSSLSLLCRLRSCYNINANVAIALCR
jgi:hypothetical protein